MNKETSGGQWSRKRTEKKEGVFRKKQEKNHGYHGYVSRNLCDRMSLTDFPNVHFKNKIKSHVKTECRNISYH